MKPPPLEPAPPPLQSSPNESPREVPNFRLLSRHLGSPNRHRLLVILDIHGLLVERARKRDPSHKFALSQRPPWRKLLGYSIWLRPHLSYFLSALISRFRVAAWTSATLKTIPPLISALSASIQLPKPLDQSLEFLWMRDQCRKDTTRPYASLKYLPDVWDAGLATEKDTLILDDSPSKVRYTPSSALVVSEYSAQNLGNGYNKDDSLLWALLYIQYLADRSDSSGSLVTARHGAIDFEAFILAGRAEARKVTNARQRKGLKSLAFVFLNAKGPAARDGGRVHRRTLMSVTSHSSDEVLEGVPSSTEPPAKASVNEKKVLTV